MKKPEIRELSDICEGELSKEWLGNTVCGIKPTMPDVICKYRMTMPDKNGMYVCLTPTYNLNDYKGEIQ